MNITCPNCKHPIPASNLDIATLDASCLNCLKNINLKNYIQTANQANNLPLQPPTNRIIVNTIEDTCVIQYRWPRLQFFFAVIITLLWNAAVGIPIWQAIANNQPIFTLQFFLENTFLLIFWIIGLFLIYGTIASILNTTTLTLSPLGLTKKESPLPHIGKQFFPANQINFFYYAIQDNGDKDTAFINGFAYKPQIKTIAGKTYKLFSPYATVEESQYITKLLNQHHKLFDVSNKHL
ncbi:hypothetical protein KS4_07740 [Poriferisphaera corsica]|uniref:Uncharacterized protein n=1 Tax=Poriferisphaera corsica TaxID=2528020 RepID=A0A517YR93_9BACT|nr:hypothetical protein [Poriferisphaera corsica]QDU32740.1 hypothetical protein KS4_07740 [Poriferisphaera corsica]